MTKAERALELYRGGMTVNEIAKLMRESPYLVGQWMRKCHEPTGQDSLDNRLGACGADAGEQGGDGMKATVRIKTGTTIMHDHTFFDWPACFPPKSEYPKGEEYHRRAKDPNMLFSGTWNGNFWTCIALGYGEIGGNYGSGSILVRRFDGVEVVDAMTPELSTATDFIMFRGKCKELSLEAQQKDPSLILVRGYYHCPMWGKQPHWWCVKPGGEIVDPSVAQFPTKGIGATYEEFDGYVECANCGKKIEEADARFESRYAFCSTRCNMRFVGL